MNNSLGLHLNELITVYPKDIPSCFQNLQSRVHNMRFKIENQDYEGRKQISQMEDILQQMLWCQLKSMGMFSAKSVSLSNIKEKIGLSDLYDKWLKESIAIFERIGYACCKGNRMKDLGKVSLQLDELWEEWDKKKIRWLEIPDMKSYVVLVEATLRRLPEILKGKHPATEVIFPNSSMELVQGIYKNNQISDYFNEVLADTIVAYIEERVKGDPQVKLRLIEIGAGTGGTSAVVLRKLRPFRDRILEYCYTDVSKAFLTHAEKEYGGDNHYLTYKIFNVEEPAKIQGIDTDSYDVVIAANVLHATKNIRQTLRNAKSVAKNNGIILLNEINSNSIFSHLTFGLLEGWWLYEDSALRIPGCPAISPNVWEEVLKSEGFREVCFPVPEAHELGQHIIVAESDGVVRTRKQLRKEESVAVQPKQEKKLKKQIISKNETTVKKGELSLDLLREKGINYLKKLVGETLQIPSGRIDAYKPLDQYGIDSIVVVQLTNLLRETFEDISSTLFFEYPTIAELVAYFIDTRKESLIKVVGLLEPEQKASEDMNWETYEADDVLEETTYVKALRSTHNEGRCIAWNDLKNQTPEVKSGNEKDLAIIGISGRFPESENIQAFWNNLLESRDLIVDIPEERWNKEAYPAWDKNAKPFCRWGGFIKDVDCFDPLFFNVSPKEAEIMDPQERLFLECVWNLFESIGYTRDRLESLYQGKVGVYVGAMYQQYHLYSSDMIKESAMALSSYSSIANRVSYFFDLKGPSIAIDTACSSSTIAVGMAVDSLIRGDCEVAVVGGVNLSIHPKKYIGLNLTQMLASDRNTRSFGNGDGFIPAECVGAVLLKPLSKAIKDNDPIMAVIKSAATNHGGHSNGYSVPNLNAQAQLIEENFKKSGIDPRTISYVEAAANGSPLGDAVEVNALIKAFNKYTSDHNFCAIGSVKSNMGHAEAASGISQLIKVILQMQHKTLVPTIKAEHLNPNINFDTSPFYLQKEVIHWKRPLIVVDGEEKEFPRRATISSFGAGGSNGHLIIEEYIPLEERNICTETVLEPQIMVFSAKNKIQLEAVLRQILDFIEKNRQTSLTDMAYTLQLGREAMQERIAMVINTQEELILGLNEYLGTDESRKCTEFSIPIYSGNLEEENNEIRSLISGRVADAVLKVLMEENDIEKIALHWTQGGKIPWELFYQGKRPVIVPLPTYPFMKRRCWLGKQMPSEYVIEEQDDIFDAKREDEIEDNVNESVVNLVAKALGMAPDEVNPNTSLYQYGFDSIMAIQLLQQLQTQIDSSFDLDKLNECENVRDIINRLNLQKRTEPERRHVKDKVSILNIWPQFPELIRLNNISKGKPVFWLHGGLGGVGTYQSIAQVCQRPFYGIQPRGFMTDRYPLHGIQAIASYYVHIIQTAQPEGPYDLGGYSLGGVLAYEIARQLQELGQVVNTIVMLDAPCGYGNFDTENQNPYGANKKTQILQALNMALLSSFKQIPESFAGMLIHRDEVDLSLCDDEFIKHVIAKIKEHGLNKSETYLNNLVHSNMKLQPTFQRERYVLYPLKNPEAVTAYYFRNKSGIFMGELEPYFVAEVNSPNLDHRDYWGEWQKFLHNSKVIDVDSSNHMALLSDPKSYEVINAYCRELYQEE